MTFGAGVIWVYLLLPIVGALAMFTFQALILRHLARIEALVNQASKDTCNG
jgi:hypothetical protein